MAPKAPETVPDPTLLPVIVAEPWSADARTRVLQILELRRDGLSQVEIGERLGITDRMVRHYLQKATQEGWLRFENPFDRFEHEIIPKVVDNIAHFIDAKDKQMTIEAAKGAGIFKSYGAVKTESDAPPNILAIKIETPAPGGDTVKIVPGQIIGRPKQKKLEDGSE